MWLLKSKALLFCSLLFFVSCTNRSEHMLSPISPLSRPAGAVSEGRPTPSVALWATDTPDPSISPVIISDVIHNGDGSEIIVITNISGSEQRLAGMALLNPKTMEHIALPDITLPPGGTFKVCNGSCTTAMGSEMQWLDRPALQEFGDHLTLLNPAGRVIWNYVYLADYP